jgi:hypothetical protein
MRPASSNSLSRRSHLQPLEGFFERPQFDFLCPRGARLTMELPVRARDGLDIEQSILAALLDHVGTAATEPIAIDAAIDHDVRHVDPLRPELPREALADRA